MPAPATTAEPTSQTDPHPDQAEAGTPPRIAGLLVLVRFLIAFGKDLAGTLQQHSSVYSFRAANTFGTNNMAAILARVTRGLLRAAALEQLLLRRAARGRDVAPPPIRPPSKRKPGSAQRTVQPRVVQEEDFDEVVRLPTAQELAAELRRRPIGEIIADICSDLGITPDQLGRARWDTVFGAITIYGGNFVRFLRCMGRRCVAPPCPALPDAVPAFPTPPPPSLPAATTGPP